MNFAAPTLHNSSRRGLPKSTVVYDDLRAAIIELRLRPGTQIDKNEICQRLGVSRQPLAEAIARLSDEGLIDVEPQKGTFVARIRMADVAEANFLRRSLEIAAVESIAPQIDEAALREIERILAYQEAAVRNDDNKEFYELDVRFHRRLLDRLAMRRVAEVVENSRAQLERARRLLLPEAGRSIDTLAEHRRIHAALVRRDPALAGEAMGAHLDTVMQELKQFSGRWPELFEP